MFFFFLVRRVIKLLPQKRILQYLSQRYKVAFKRKVVVYPFDTSRCLTQKANPHAKLA